MLRAFGLTKCRSGLFRGARLPASVCAVKRINGESRVFLGAAALIIGGFVVGVSLVCAAIIDSYDGTFASVRCFDPNIPLCTGLYYGYGMPGIVPLFAAALGIAVLVFGIILLKPARDGRPGNDA